MNLTELQVKLQGIEKEVLRLSGLSGTAEGLGINFNIQDTEFLLKLIHNASIPGTQLKQAEEISNKINILHNVLLNRGINVG
tara:strand:- start:798 stop:1043 length:246 start_codon:yes stop_codon:yes gene_type:complete